MNVCVFGAGAIGSFLALSLARGGATVAVVARGEQLAAIKAGGLRAVTPAGELHAPLAASADPAELGPQDLVVVTLKAPMIAAAVAGINVLLGPQTSVAFIMNGVPWWYGYYGASAAPGPALPAEFPAARAIRDALAPERVFGGVVYSSCTLSAPGVVQVQNAKSRVIIGEPDGSISARANALAAALNAGDIDTNVVADVRKDIWEKVAANVGTGPMSVLTQTAPKDFLQDPECERLTRAAVAETCAIAAAAGYPIVFDIERQLGVWKKSPHLPSIAQDLARGRPLEFDALYGRAWQIAHALEVATPALDVMLPLVRARATGAGCYPA
jgi:2-dehydropantoate 2-reductase